MVRMSKVILKFELKCCDCTPRANYYIKFAAKMKILEFAALTAFVVKLFSFQRLIFKLPDRLIKIHLNNKTIRLSRIEYTKARSIYIRQSICDKFTPS